MSNLRQEALSILDTDSSMQMDIRMLWAMEAQAKAMIHLADTIAIYGDLMITEMRQ